MKTRLQNELYHSSTDKIKEKKYEIFSYFSKQYRTAQQNASKEAGHKRDFWLEVADKALEYTRYYAN